MWKFIKYVLATFIGTVLGVIVLVLIGVGIVAGVAASVMDEDPVEVEPNSILVLKFDQPIVERASHNPLKNLDISTMKNKTELGLHDIVKSIIVAKDDPNIKGIFLNSSSVRAGISTVDEIRNALIRFKESGKFIISFNEFYSQGGYYLASVADKIYLKPEGLVEFKGLSAQALFFKDALKKIGVAPQVIRHGKYKGAVEPFIADEMSPENREQIKVYVESVWQHVLNGISGYRRLSVFQLNEIADKLTVRNAPNAVSAGLIDQLKYYDEVLVELKDSLQMDESKDIPAVLIGDYISNIEKKEKVNNVLNEKDEIAVIVASGDIISGEGEDDNIGGERIARAIREARRDENIKAIVFRVNSGGGSALASESIWRESLLASQQKTFVVSMGDAAASGGYYIACPADYIVANPTTITGSIGVFGILPNAEELMNNIGISTQVVNTNKYSDIGTITRSLKDKEKEVIGKSIDEIYETFITHVAEGREMPVEMVDSVGQGRIWTGTDAYSLGLIDMLGDMQTAIQVACDMEEIKDYKIKYLPKSEDPFEQLFESFSSVEDAKIKELLGDSYIYYDGFKDISTQKGVQARIPFKLVVE